MCGVCGEWHGSGSVYGSGVCGVCVVSVVG